MNQFCKGGRKSLFSEFILVFHNSCWDKTWFVLLVTFDSSICYYFLSLLYFLPCTALNVSLLHISKILINQFCIFLAACSINLLHKNSVLRYPYFIDWTLLIFFFLSCLFPFSLSFLFSSSCNTINWKLYNE